MPDEYISRRDARIAILEKQVGGRLDQKITVGSAEAVINAVPAADVAPVVHGRWYMLDDCANAGLYCSACGRRVYREEFAYKKLRSKYCPHCGARMDGGVDHA